MQGVVSNCQHTLKVWSGANNTSTTTYIALFRVSGRPVQFRSSSPSSVSDGDQVSVAGLPWQGSVDVLACRNLTTGETMNAGVWANVVGAILIPMTGVFIGVVTRHMLGGLVSLLDFVFTLGFTAYIVHRVILIRRAIAAVGS